MDTATTYRLDYLDIGGIDVSERFTGDHQGLTEQIAMIEGGGGQQLIVHAKDKRDPIYDCGGFVI